MTQREVMTYDLDTRFDHAKSFYGKAKVVEVGDIKVLYSYGTKVMVTNKESVILNSKVDSDLLFGATTLRHMVELLNQEYGYSDLPDRKWNKKRIIEKAKMVDMQDSGYQRLEDKLASADNPYMVAVYEK